MDLTFADEPLRLLCGTQELLVRTFGSAWRSAARCLATLRAAETLADITAFATIMVYRVLQAVEGMIEFVIDWAPVHVRVRTLSATPRSSGQPDDRKALALVRAVCVTSVTLAPVAVGA